MTDIPEEIRYYPFPNRASESFSLREAADAIGFERDNHPLTNTEIEHVRGYLELLKGHELDMYRRVHRHQYKTAMGKYSVS